jgi:hypothetical protein
MNSCFLEKQVGFQTVFQSLGGTDFLSTVVSPATGDIVKNHILKLWKIIKLDMVIGKKRACKVSISNSPKDKIIYFLKNSITFSPK